MKTIEFLLCFTGYLTTGIDQGASYVGGAGNDTFNALDGAGAVATFTALDLLDGGAGTDTLNITQTTAFATVASAVVKNIENANITSGLAVNADVSGWTGLTALKVTSSAALVDMERRTWKIPTTKTGKARHVPISLALLAILQSLPRWKDCPYVVPNPKTKLPFVSVFYSWRTARKQAGLPEVRMHDLRHSMASNMVNSGRSIYEVAKVLGHTQLKTSQRYSHLSQETLLAAVDASANAAGSGWGQALTAKAGDNLAVAAV